MATAITHSFAAAALGKMFFPEKMPRRFWVLAVLCGIIPDIDVVGFRLGIRYGDLFGHRGFLHSLLFALLVGLLVAVLAFPEVRRFTRKWWLLAGFFFLATASHDVLDAMTDGGYGVAFFSPFDRTRYFLPWQPLHVSPIGVKGFLSHRGLTVLLSELHWVWTPLILAMLLLPLFHRRRPAVAAVPEPLPLEERLGGSPQRPDSD